MRALSSHTNKQMIHISTSHTSVTKGRFIGWINGFDKLVSRKLLYLENYKLRSLNLHNAILYNILKRGKVERVLFHPHSSQFLKEKLFDTQCEVCSLHQVCNLHKNECLAQKSMIHAKSVFLDFLGINFPWTQVYLGSDLWVPTSVTE